MDPFKFFSHEFEYHAIESTKIWYEEDHEDESYIRYTHEILLDYDKQILKRTRLDYLQILERVGGFHDGLVLVIGNLLVPLAATYFNKDFIKESNRNPKHTHD